MARFLIAATSVPGHVFPLLAVSQHLVSRGHEVIVHTGSLFRDRVEATGARFVAFCREIPAERIIVDTMFCGTFPLLLGPPEKRIPIVALGITALALSSADTAFFGTALPPSITPEDRARNSAMKIHS